MNSNKNILLESSVFKGIKAKLPLTGILRSIRLTWEACVEDCTLNNLIEVSQKLADSPIKKVFTNGEKNSQFVLVQFENMVVAEITISDSFISQKPPIFYIHTNSTNGILTNKPIVGYLPVDGSILIDDNAINYERSEKIFQL